MNNNSLINTSVLKSRLPDYLQAIGHPPKFFNSETKFAAICPLHDDHDPSLKGTLKDDVWLWRCFPCDKGGTIIDLHAAQTGRHPKADFALICRELGELLGVQGTKASSAFAKRPAYTKSTKVTKAIPADDLETLTTPWRYRLHGDHKLREHFARGLGLKAETLRRLTSPALDAFGITPVGLQIRKTDGNCLTLRKPRLCYIGDGGYKIRAPFGDSKEPPFWKVGELRRPWRSHWLVGNDSQITDVHLVESESDAAALIEVGLEDPFAAGSCVVATSGANGFKAAWVPLFAGRNVHFWPDSDPAGRKFLENTASLLQGTARTIVEHQYNLQRS